MEDWRKTALRQIKDRRQVLSGVLSVLARKASGIIRRATKKYETFPERFPEEKAAFPERFPKSSRTKGCFSRTTPEHVPRKPAKNVEEIGDKRRISVG